MSEVKLGEILDSTIVDRDATHVAVIPVECLYRVTSGTRVGIKEGKASPHITPHVGIIDPFLYGWVEAGTRCYVVMFPNTVVNLRHQWEHPLIKELAIKISLAETENKLRHICELWGIDYPTLILNGHTEVCASTTNDLPDEFWDLYQALTSRVVDRDRRYIHCGC